jgi:DNA polymerase-3 subunit gamma/tau
MARAADGSVRDALSLLEQARAYCGTQITEAQVRELLGVVSAEVLDELVAAIETHSAQRALGLVHRLLSEGQNLQQFCREAVGHFRNLLVARVCGVDSDLVAAPLAERPRLERAAGAFTEEDLTRFFQILLVTEDDLRRKPDPRLHLEIGLLRLVNAARLAPLEEVIAELSGQGTTRSARADAAPKATGVASLPVRQLAQVPVTPPAAPPFSQPQTSSQPHQAQPIAKEPAINPAGVMPGTRGTAASSTSSAPPAARASVTAMPAASTPPAAAPLMESPTRNPVPASPPSAVANVASGFSGLESAQVEAIKAAVLSQQRFLGELVDHAARWELDGGEIRLYFPTESRALAELLQAREPMEKLRTISSRVLGQALRVCVKLEAGPVLSRTVRAEQGVRDLRARFEQDPIVRAMLERFGGRISDVKRRGEE